ncbi:MAG: flagellin, partial [Sulfurimonas sp.]|nr:flagellin [Sulfurimonas sp.]
MGFRINTNIAAMASHSSALQNNRNLDNSLSKLSSGLRINKAADDASGLAIANALRAQASSLGQAISNGNDAIGLIQTADGALNEYSNILDTIKTKAVQAASDGQNSTTRLAIQKDIDKLMEELNTIAKTTSFNGQKLLSGTF